MEENKWIQKMQEENIPSPTIKAAAKFQTQDLQG